MDLADEPIVYYWPSQPSYCSEAHGPFVHGDEINRNISLNSEIEIFHLKTFEEIRAERGESTESLEGAGTLTGEYAMNTMRSLHSFAEECEDGMLMVHSQGKVFWFDETTEDHNGQINFAENNPRKKAKTDPAEGKGKSLSRWQQPDRNSQQEETIQMAENGSDASRSIPVDPFTCGILADGEEISDEESRNLVLKIDEILDYDVQEPDADNITADDLVKQIDRWLAERGLLQQQPMNMFSNNCFKTVCLI